MDILTKWAIRILGQLTIGVSVILLDRGVVNLPIFMIIWVAGFIVHDFSIRQSS